MTGDAVQLDDNRQAYRDGLGGLGKDLGAYISTCVIPDAVAFFRARME